MPVIHPACLAHERQRFMRADPHRFLRPDWRRFVTPCSALAVSYEDIQRKYRPDQPRVPAGSRDGGQWTDEGEQGTSSEASRSRTRVAGTVIYVCVAGSRSRATDAWGNKSFMVIYECGD
jgi:hypothetical protein